MYIVHCHYNNRDIKRLINQLLAKGVTMVSKTNYHKMYSRQEQKTMVGKGTLLYIYCDEKHQGFVESFVSKHMADCYCTFIADRPLVHGQQ